MTILDAVILVLYLSCSIVSFQHAFVDYVIPKTYFNATDKSYYASITVCVALDKNSNPGIGGGRGGDKRGGVGMWEGGGCVREGTKEEMGRRRGRRRRGRERMGGEEE